VDWQDSAQKMVFAHRFSSMDAIANLVEKRECARVGTEGCGGYPGERKNQNGANFT
jgi:hypothetical protein